MFFCLHRLYFIAGNPRNNLTFLALCIRMYIDHTMLAVYRIPDTHGQSAAVPWQPMCSAFFVPDLEPAKFVFGKRGLKIHFKPAGSVPAGNRKSGWQIV